MSKAVNDIIIPHYFQRNNQNFTERTNQSDICSFYMQIHVSLILNKPLLVLGGDKVY